jgi:WD40 repeat protein
MNEPEPSPFFFVGGALPVDAPSYIPRQADESLFASLLRGEFCYVLVSRQIGKSSLMLRTASRLRKEGVRVVVLDLNTIGHDVSAEQWYYSLVMQTARRLNLRDEIRAFWESADDLTPLQRWIGGIQQILLHVPSQRLVIFLDEVDQIRLLPFSADEFFAAIRSCYGRRAEDPEFERLSFCLLGVALPSDLIRDPRMTPFNIGRRIELTDFEEAQVMGFEAGLERAEIIGEVLLRRVFYWTNGHPYLTQRLCREIVDSPEVSTPQQVDALCTELFLSADAQEQDDNLAFVRDRLLQSETDIADLLLLYQRIYRGQAVHDDRGNRQISILRLSGIVQVCEGRLQVRNRIYASVFNRNWVTEQMPGAEVRRQRSAFRRGVIRTAAAALVLLGVVSALAITALNQSQSARRATVQLLKTQEQLKLRERQNRQDLYVADMRLAQQYWEEGNLQSVDRLLAAHLPAQDGQDLRGFEWRHLWSLSHQDYRTLRGHNDIVYCVDCSPDGKTIASGSFDKTVKLWDIATGKVTRTLAGYRKWISAVKFSPDGRILAVGSADGTLTVMDIGTGRQLWHSKEHRREITALAFTPDSATLVSIEPYDGQRRDSYRPLCVWDVRSGAPMHLPPTKAPAVQSIAFSPDGKTLAVAYRLSSKIALWDATRWRNPRMTTPAPSRQSLTDFYSLAYAPNGKWLAAGNSDGRVMLWNTQTRRRPRLLKQLTGVINSIAFSPDGNLLAAASWDYTIEVFNLAKGTCQTLPGHTDRVNSVAFSRDGRFLISGGSDNTVRLWDVGKIDEAAVRPVVTIRTLPARPSPTQLMVSADSRAIARLDGGRLRLLDRDALREMPVPAEPGRGVDSFAFAPDKNLIAVAQGPTCTLWDWRRWRKMASWSAQKGELPLMMALCPPDGRLLATVSQKSDLMSPIQVWDTTFRPTLKQTILRTAISTLSFSPDGRLLAVASGKPATVELWDCARWQRIGTLQGPRDLLQAGTFAPAGALYAAADWAGPVFLWDVTTHKIIARLQGHKQFVNSVAFAPDGKTLATAGNDGSVKLWNTATWREMARFQAPNALRVTFSPDGRTLIVMAPGRIHLWRAASLAEIEARERRDGRP